MDEGFFSQISREAEQLGEALTRHALFCVTAESCTGGLLGAALTHVAGASCWFSGGVIAYSNDVKAKLLGVSADDLALYGAVSHPVVRQMALGACSAFGADMAAALSGVAGPDGGSEAKPVGTVYLGLALRGVGYSFRYQFAGNREAIRQAAVKAAIARMSQLLDKPV